MATLSLDRQLCFALYSASRAMTAAYRPILTELNLTYPQYLVLLVLWEEGRVTVGRLGERLQLDSGTLSPLLKRLEANGFVRRERSLDDERLVDVTLTPAGRRLERKRPVHPRTAVLLDRNDRKRRRGPARRGPAPHRCAQRIQPKGNRMKTLYTAEALTTGDGRDGHARSSDGRLDLELAIPKEMGGSGDGTNPEQLFAIGYAACFHSALRLVGRQDKADGVGFQNSATASDQRFQAAGSYSLIRPPRTGRRRILPWTGSGTGDSGRGGRSCSARCGRCVL